MIDYATAWLLVLQVLDAFTTHRILQKGGVELNPVLSYLFSKFGAVRVLFLSKAIIMSLIGYLYANEQATILAILAVVYTLVVANNWREMEK